LTIARHKLFDSHRRGRVEDVARRRLALERVAPDLDEIEAVGMDVEAALSTLPPADRAALRARVLDEQPYEDIARVMNTTEPAVRQRVSRALRRLRTDLEKQR
jgi:RNA polymerase sigma-70 factor (ECF subfamily)